MNKRHYYYLLTVILLLIVVVAGWFATDYLGNRARLDIIEDSKASLSTPLRVCKLYIDTHRGGS